MSLSSEAETARVFMDAAVTLKRRIELMMALPLDSLQRLAIQQDIDAIGKA